MFYSALKRGFGSGGFIIVILLFIIGGTYYYNEKYGPIFKAAGCEKSVTLYNAKSDGASLPQTVNLRGASFRIDSHIEAEDKWASFNVNGSSGSSVANPLAVKGSGLPFPQTTSIKGLSITVKKIGLTSDGREFVQVCLS
ncbi:MAG: hypothetical protein AAB455_01025 [Patescibacteria group bacterium]